MYNLKCTVHGKIYVLCTFAQEKCAIYCTYIECTDILVGCTVKCTCVLYKIKQVCLPI